MTYTHYRVTTPIGRRVLPSTRRAPAVLGLVVLAGWLILWVVIGGEGRRELRLDRSVRRYSDRFGGQR